MIPPMVAALIAFGCVLLAALLAWLLPGISGTVRRRRRAARQLRQVQRELTRNATKLRLLPSAQPGRLPYLENTVYTRNRESLSDLVDDDVETTLEAAYKEIADVEAELLEGPLPAGRAREAGRRVEEAAKRVQPRQSWWRRLWR
jgi:hypothetical protein